MSISITSLDHAAILIVTCYAFYLAGLAFHRLFLHPLAKFPGPRLAGLTYWYEFYYDVYKNGRYLFQIKDLHVVYGPIIRVNPNEVHISDPDFYHEIYHNKSYETDRDVWFNLAHLKESLPFTIDHDVHHRRRQSLTNYFSARSIFALEERVANVVSLMRTRLVEVSQTGEVVNLLHVFAALTMDVVAEYSFGKTSSLNVMSNPDFGKWWIDITEASAHLNPLSKQFPALMGFIFRLPSAIIVRLMPGMAAFLTWQSALAKQIENTITQNDKSHITPQGDLTLISELINSSKLLPVDKTVERLKDEASVLLSAGTETTAVCLARTMFHVLNTPVALQKVKEELKGAISNIEVLPSLTLLGSLPYFNAVIEEGIRLSFPVTSRAPRVFKRRTLVYQGSIIPPGVAVSQSSFMVGTNSKIFPEPYQFNPDRWLKQRGLQKYQVAFTKGRRMCLGINLAYAELRLGLAVALLHFDFELFETTNFDADVVHDFFIGVAARQSKGIRVKVNIS